MCFGLPPRTTSYYTVRTFWFASTFHKDWLYAFYINQILPHTRATQKKYLIQRHLQQSELSKLVFAKKNWNLYVARPRYRFPRQWILRSWFSRVLWVINFLGFFSGSGGGGRFPRGGGGKGTPETLSNALLGYPRDRGRWWPFLGSELTSFAKKRDIF